LPIISQTEPEEDWRLRGQERYLQGATLLRKRYKAWSPDWEHDHCEFCWAKFIDPNFSADQARLTAEHPEVLSEGYAVQGRQPDEAGPFMGRVYGAGQIDEKVPSATPTDYWWVCPKYVGEFAERFEWTVLERHATDNEAI
jgi:hypothetical protein